MRAFAFLLTATGFATIFIGVVLASVTLTANTKERPTPQHSILAN
jgi:hypothetical protein